MKTLEKLKEIAEQNIEANRKVIADTAEYIWKNPETGFREYKTAATATEILKRLGLHVQENLAVTGFRADFDTGKPGPVIAVLGEMDALLLPSHPEANPETGAVHACGHHTHITSMLGCALGMCCEEMKENLCGKIAFIGCPAEECIEAEFRQSLIKKGVIAALGGKPSLIQAHVFDDVDAALMIHIGGDCGAMDSNGFVNKMVKFSGKSCHAASPQNGINAMNAADLAKHALALMRETFSNDRMIRLHGLMTHCGDSVSIIPDDVRLEYQIRADAPDKLSAISCRFDAAMRGCAAAIGCEVEIVTLPGYWPMKNSSKLYEIFLSEAKRVYDEDIQGEIYDNPGCTDMGDVSAIMPAIHPFVPGGGARGHSVDYFIPDTVNSCIKMAKIMAGVTVDLLAGNAEQGKKIAADKKNHLTVNEYIEQCGKMAVTDYSEKK